MTIATTACITVILATATVVGHEILKYRRHRDRMALLEGVASRFRDMAVAERAAQSTPEKRHKMQHISVKSRQSVLN
jgi:hypothetical protein